MAKLKDRQHLDPQNWFEDSHMVRVVNAASALEGGVIVMPHIGEYQEAKWPQLPHTDNLDSVIPLRAPLRTDWTKFDTNVLHALSIAITDHIDAVAAQLEVTPDQLYSMTFADFIARHEEKEESPKRQKSLTERFNEAYDEDAKREDEAFFRSARKYYRRRFSAED